MWFWVGGGCEGCCRGNSEWDLGGGLGEGNYDREGLKRIDVYLWWKEWGREMCFEIRGIMKIWGWMGFGLVFGKLGGEDYGRL